MKLFIYVTISLLLSVECGKVRERRKPQNSFFFRDYDDIHIALSTNNEPSTDVAAAPKADAPKQGFSQGAGLRQIAQGSADQANTALGNQHAAAKQAAFVAKNTLAQAAAQASATAQAALAGKQIILQGLEQQFRDAKVALDGEKQQMMTAQRAADASQQASQQAMQQVNIIQAALNAAQVTSDHASQAASEAAGELAAQRAMVGSAQQRLKTLGEQLLGVRIDFEATQQAAAKAMAAAQAAQAAAAEAAAAAAAAAAASAPPPPPPPPKPSQKPKAYKEYLNLDEIEGNEEQYER